MQSRTITIDINNRGKNISSDHQICAERLRAQALEVQSRLELMEQTISILSEMIDPSTDIAKFVDNTYEGNAFIRLQFQLFRILIIDICAGILDDDNRTSSIRAILKELRRDSIALDSLKAYYADPTCLLVTVENESLDMQDIEIEKKETINRKIREDLASISKQWVEIDTDAQILNGDDAKRILWARNSVVAHYEKSPAGLIALNDNPPYGIGKLTWDEPICFFGKVRPFVYQVIGLITSTSWDEPRSSKFYAKCFWDRFKNGSTTLKP